MFVVPAIDLDDMPFGDLEAIDVNTPEGPDFSAFTNFQDSAIKALTPALPDSMKSVFDCAGDFACMSESMGLGNLEDMVDPLLDMMETIREVSGKFTDAMQSITCSSWELKTIPVEDMLSKAGITGIVDDICDVEMNICTGIDLSEVDALMDEVGDSMKPIISNLMGTSHGRRLFVQGNDSFLPFVGLSFLLGPVLSKGSLDLKSKIEPVLFGAIKIPVSDLKHKNKQPMGFHFRGEVRPSAWLLKRQRLRVSPITYLYYLCLLLSANTHCRPWVLQKP